MSDVSGLLKARRFAEAEAAIRAELGDARSYRLLGRALEGQGRRNEAVAAWKRAVELDPADTDAPHRLGLLLARAGKARQAIPWFERLTRLAPDRADAWTNLGLALREERRTADAIAAFDQALSLGTLPVALAVRAALAIDDPRAVGWLRTALEADLPADVRREASIALGRALRRAGDLDGAEAAFRAVLPDADASGRLVRLLLARNRLEDAVEAALSGRMAHPADADLARLAGIAMGRSGRNRDSLEHFRDAVRLRPDGGAWANLASACWAAGARAEALEAAREAVKLAPDLALAQHTLGLALEKDPAAIVHLERALALEPDDTVRGDLAHALRRESRLSEAMALYESVLSRDSDHAGALSGAAGVAKDQGLAAKALSLYRRAHALRPEDQAVWDNLLLALHYDPGVTGPQILDAHLDWGRHAERRTVERDRPRTAGPIRVGYVSGDLGLHPVGAFLLGVIPAHDRGEFRVHCYSTRTNPDDYTRRFQAASDRWIDATTLSEDELVAAIAADDIDVLVDLAGHTKGHRLGAFARRAGRVQATWAGYVGTTGLSRMDWLIGDAVHTPTDAESIERVCRMPEGYVPYTPPPSPDVGEPRGPVTFGCFNNVAKLSPPTIALWRRILGEVPSARLVLLSHSFADAGVRAYFSEAFGDVARRVEMRGRVGHKTLLRTYAEEIDIALDPFPYSGGVTTLEALWMGVPVITLGGGDRFCSRHSAGHLTHTGEPDKIAVDPDDYVRKAVELAADEDRRRRERLERRDRMAASPVLDSRRFTRNLEAAFRAMLAAR